VIGQSCVTGSRAEDDLSLCQTWRMELGGCSLRSSRAVPSGASKSLHGEAGRPSVLGPLGGRQGPSWCLGISRSPAMMSWKVHGIGQARNLHYQPFPGGSAISLKMGTRLGPRSLQKMEPLPLLPPPVPYPKSNPPPNPISPTMAWGSRAHASHTPSTQTELASSSEKPGCPHCPKMHWLSGPDLCV
jgi:hypothetical protein